MLKFFLRIKNEFTAKKSTLISQFFSLKNAETVGHMHRVALYISLYIVLIYGHMVHCITILLSHLSCSYNDTSLPDRRSKELQRCARHISLEEQTTDCDGSRVEGAAVAGAEWRGQH